MKAAEAIGDDRLQQRPGPCRAGFIHAWLLGAARPLAEDRAQERRHQELRHLPGEQPLRRFPARLSFRGPRSGARNP